MSCVTLIVSGVPQNVTLTDLSYNLNFLFDTGEIGSFQLRELPVHPRTYKAQIALDFNSGFDAMAAQEKLDGYPYLMPNGQEYRLSAKINRLEEYARPRPQDPERAGRWNAEKSWPALAVIPNVSDSDMFRAHAKLDAQLELLNKHKKILETEKEILREQKLLRREYRLMHGYDSGNEASTSKRSRSRSHEHPSSSQSGSRSRDHSRQSCDYNLPELPWHEKGVAIRELRSHSKERSQDGDRWERSSRSKERHADWRSSREPHRSQEGDRWERRSRSKERHADWRLSREPHYRSRSRERVHRNSSTSRDCYRERPVSFPDLQKYRDSIENTRSHRVFCPKTSRTQRNQPLAIMGKSPERSKSPHSRPPVVRKEASNPPINHISDANKNNDRDNTEKNKLKDNTQPGTSNINDDDNKKQYAKRDNKQIKKKIKKFNSKVRKAAQLEEKVESITKDVMFLVFILLEEIFVKDQIKISESDKLLLDKELVAIVKERVEPLARVKTNNDVDVLRQYKALYPRQTDLSMLKRMLNKIPKVIRPDQCLVSTKESTNTDANASILTQKKYAGNLLQDNIDMNEGLAGIESTETNTGSNNANLVKNTPNDNCSEVIEVVSNMPPGKTNNTDDIVSTTFENKDYFPRLESEVKKEIDEEIVVIDNDSEEKPVPKRPEFVIGIKTLLNDLTKVIKDKNLIEQIPIFDLKYVLRDILKGLLKGQSCMPYKDIIKKFRSIYPKEEDEQFIQNAIKDLKDGKYPRLTNIAAVDDCEDDVIVIEKKYDIVTIEDSDDDKIEVEGPSKVNNLENESKERRAQNEACSSNASPETEPDNSGTSDPTTKIGSDLDKLKPGSIKTVPETPVPAKIPIPISTTPLQPVNPELSNLESVQTENPQSQKILNNPSVAKLTPAHPSPNQINPVNSDPSCLRPAQLRPAQPGATKFRPTHPIPNQIHRVNPEPSCPRPTQIRPTLPRTLTHIPPAAQSRPAHSNLNQMKPANPKPGQQRPTLPRPVTNIPNAAKYKPAHSNPKQKPKNPKPSFRPTQIRPNQPQLRPANPVPSLCRPTYQNQNGPKPSQPQTNQKNPTAQIRPPHPNSYRVSPPDEPFWFGPVYPGLDQLGSPRNITGINALPKIKGASNPIVKNVPEKKSGVNMDEDTHLQSESKENGVTQRVMKPEICKGNGKKETNEDKENIDENSGSLKVTGITIVTSLTELTAMTDKNIDESKKEILIENIKEENSEEEPVESKIVDSVPRVTSITIMTSDTELFSLGNETDEPKEIKDEKVDDKIEATNDSGIHIDDIVNGINCTEKGNSVPLKTTADKQNATKANGSSDNEDETMESIIKYVQSLV